VFEEMKTENADSNELALTLNVTKTGESTTSSGTTVALEIDMTAVMSSTTAGVTTVTSDNITSFSDYVTIDYNLGTGLANVTALHKGNAMVNSANTDDDEGNGIYVYDATTGILTIKTKTLSPFSVRYVLDGQGAAVALTAENTELYNGYLIASTDIVLEAPFNGGTARVVIEESANLDPNATELKLTIEKEETVIFGRTVQAYVVNVSGLKDAYTSYKVADFPCAFDIDAGDSLYMKNQYTTADVTSYVGSMIPCENGVLDLSDMYWTNGRTIAVAHADPSENDLVDLKDLQDVLSVANASIAANDDNAKGDAVKSRGASIKANGFTMSGLRVLTETQTNGGLYVEGNGTTIEDCKFEARWLGNYADTIKIKGSDTTIKNTEIAHYQTASSNGRYAGVELTTDTASSVTTIDHVKFTGMEGLLFRSFAGKINITNSVFDVSGRAIKLNVDSGPNTGSAYIKDCTIKASSIGFMRIGKGVVIENTSFATPSGTGNFTIETGDNLTTNITFRDCTFNSELLFPGSTTGGFKTVVTFENCTYLGNLITADNISTLFNFSVGSTMYHVAKTYNGTTMTITVAAN